MGAVKKGFCRCLIFGGAYMYGAEEGPDNTFYMYMSYYITLLQYCDCAFDGESFTWTYEGNTTYDYNDQPFT